jgi:hypothetical protein
MNTNERDTRRETRLTPMDRVIFNRAGLNPDAFDVEVRYGDHRVIPRATMAWIDGKGDLRVLRGNGTAFCAPGDNFCRKVGRIKAVGRAISNMLAKGKVKT